MACPSAISAADVTADRGRCQPRDAPAGRAQPGLLSDQLTVASAINPRRSMAKTIVVRDGRIVAKRPSVQAFTFAFREVGVASLDDLGAAVEGAAAAGAIVVRARPKAAIGRRAIYDDAERGPAGLVPVPRRHVAFDWDGLPLTPIEADPIPAWIADDPAEACRWAEADPLLDPEIGVRHALRRLPAAFRDVSCFWQISASAGLAPGFRLRTWHWLDHPTTGGELKVWLAPAIDRKLVDPCTLLDCQPIYLGVLVEGGPDPCPRRFGFLRRERDAVPVPDIAGIRRRADERQEQERRARWQDARRDSATAHRHSSGRDYARQRIDDALATIRGAAARHPTYVAEAARVRAICIRQRLDWPSISRELIAAYESTLTAAEARRRERSSTLGVLAWLDRRAAA